MDAQGPIKESRARKVDSSVHAVLDAEVRGLQFNTQKPCRNSIIPALEAEEERHGVLWDKLTPPYHSHKVTEKRSKPYAVASFKAHFLVNNQKGGHDFNGTL